MDSILQLIKEERERQDKKWGEQNHDNALWCTILMEEVGEVANAILEERHNPSKIESIKEELVQVASVAVAMLECLERKQNRKFVVKILDLFSFPGIDMDKLNDALELVDQQIKKKTFVGELIDRQSLRSFDEIRKNNVQLSNVSHSINKIYLDQGGVFVEGVILGTPKGLELMSITNFNNKGVKFEPRLKMTHENGFTVIHEILSVDAVV